MPQQIKLRGGTFTLLVVQVVDLRDPGFFIQLAEKIAQAPTFFQHAPVVLDLQGLSGDGPFHFDELVLGLRQHQLTPVGVQNGTEEQNLAAVEAGLSVFPVWRSAPSEDNPEPASRPEKQTVGGRATVVTRPIRSGKEVYARGGDLIVMTTASTGAELLADGHVHVYGRLRGRAHAGVTGDQSARIFCQILDAELVSVAGHWRVRDDIPEDLIGKAVQIFLDGERLMIEPLT
jgi:septum site-determining protein MinC